MKALVTGMHGTVAPALAQALSKAGHEVIPWDRTVVPIDNAKAVRDFIRDEQPDFFFHVAVGSPDWAEWAAQTCAEEGIRFLFTSSVSVYSSSQRGPFTVDILPQPDDDYGRYKLGCERRVCAVHPEARVVRLGWQIGTKPGGNQMFDFFDRTFRTQGRIEASINFFPACTFLPDMADSLLCVIQTLPAGLYHLDGNPGLSFHDIAVNLNRLHGNPWRVFPCDSPVQNNRMLDHRVQVNPITRTFSHPC
jgi:dTDP-4-dehydrorhamnose reductase